jgi:hypothetical protein
VTLFLAGEGVLAAGTPLSALGAALYLGIAFLVLRLSIRWAREALGETPAPAAVGADRGAGRGSSPKSPARG